MGKIHSSSVLAQIEEAAGMPVTEQMAIEELGLDSLELADLMIELEIPFEETSELYTVGDISAYLSSRKVG